MTAAKLPDPYPEHGASRDDRSAHRSALRIGFGISTATHLLLILMYSLGIDEWGPRDNSLSVETSTGVFSGMRVVNVVEIAPPEAPAEVALEEVEPEAEPEVEEAGPESAAPPSDEGEEAEETPRVVRASEVMRVRSSDSRLWRAALPELFELSEAERLQLELAGLLEAWHDSVAVALAAERAMTDWTVTDDEGNRWGVSGGQPPQLHLGGFTLPLPFGFGGNAWQRERADRRAWEDADIMNSISSQAARASWAERAKAIRERKDRQRERSQERPDTTRSSGRRPPGNS